MRLGVSALIECYTTRGGKSIIERRSKIDSKRMLV